MNKLFILPYKAGSQSAKSLAQALDCRRIKLVNSRYRPRQNHIVINWGNSHGHPACPSQYYLNHPDCVSAAGNKLRTFQILEQQQVPHLCWTTDKEEAQRWSNAGCRVYSRTDLCGHSGRGIVLNEPDSLVQNAPLYTKRFKTKWEYRVHCSPNQIIHISQKRRRENNDGEPSRFIRNHDNGWVFCHTELSAPLSQEHQDICKEAVNALCLDFGAVDFLVDSIGNGVVCEVNTAPGIEGITLQKYVDFFNSYRN